MSNSSEVPDDAVRSQIEKMQHQVKKQEHARTIELVHLKSHLAAFADQLERNGDYDLDRLTPVQTIERHVAERFAESSIDLDPFPHVVVEDLFPADWYDHMLASVPPGEFFSHGARGVKSNLVLTREADPMMGFFELAPPYAREVWTRIEGVVARQILAPRLLALFREHLIEKYSREIGEEARDIIAAFDYANIDGRIMRRLPGYRIKPHSDPRQSGLTCLIYLTPDDSHERFGTDIYRVESDEAPPFDDKYYADNEQVPYRLVKMSPYRRNTMLAFVNGSRSLHGVTLDRESCAADFVRLAYQFYISPYVWQIDEAQRAALGTTRLKEPRRNIGEA